MSVLGFPKLLFLGGGAVIKELYLPALVRLGWLRQCACVETSERSIEAIRSVCKGLTIHRADYREFLERNDFVSKFDGVIVAVPNVFHEDAVIRSLEKGLHVLCEKPLALTGDACLRLAEAANEAERQLSVAMVRRLIPSVTAIREALHGGLLGDLKSLEIRHGSGFQWPSDSGSYFRKENGGLLVNMGVHYLDMIEDWVGPLAPVDYRDDNGGGVEANVYYRLLTASGAQVELGLSFTHELDNRIIVRGTRGEITVSVEEFDGCTWRCFDTGLEGRINAQVPFRFGNRSRDFISAFAEQLAEFGEVIAGRELPRVDARQAAKTLELIEWAYHNRRPLYASRFQTADRPRLTPGRVVVTGGTGFTGGRLVERLSEIGFDDIVVPIRSYRSGANVARFRAERVLTDLLSFKSVQNVVSGARYVFHLAYGKDNNAAQVTIQGTRNVLEAAIQAGAEVVVVVSTCSVFGYPEASKPIDEAFPYRPALGDYGRSKAKAERFALARARSSPKTRIVVINPAAIYGPGGPLFTEFPIRSARRGEFCWIEGGRGKINYVFVDNLIDALLLAAQCPEAHGERFIVSDGYCTMRAFLSPILGSLADTLPNYTGAELQAMESRRRAGVRELLQVLTNEEVMEVVNRVPILSAVKKRMERHLGGIYRRLQRKRKMWLAEDNGISESSRPIPPAWLADIFGPIENVYSAAKARRVLGWLPRVSLEEGQQAAIDWLEILGIFPNEAGKTAASLDTMPMCQ
jgi:predicted dehydrogenase/nucleoside-diphosphate-sugar epimerase